MKISSYPKYSSSNTLSSERFHILEDRESYRNQKNQEGCKVKVKLGQRTTELSPALHHTTQLILFPPSAGFEMRGLVGTRSMHR